MYMSKEDLALDNLHCGRPPTISKSLNQTTHGQCFVQWFPTRGITRFFMASQNTTERVEERTNEQTRDWVSSKCKKEEVYVTPLCRSPCICRLSRAYILRETSTKRLRMLTYLLTVFSTLLPSSHCLLLSTVSSSGQLSQANCSLLPSFVNWLCLLSDLPFLLHFGYRPQALCVGFAPK